MYSLIIDSILSDINISNDEKLMLIALNSLNDASNCVKAPYELLLKYLSSKNKVKMAKILKALESKGYIEIIRKMGTVNKYKLIKDYLLKDNIEEKLDSSKDISVIGNSINESDVATEIAVSKVESNYKNTNSRNHSTVENTSSESKGTAENTHSKNASTTEITASISNNNDNEIERFKDNNINNNNYNNINNKLYINILNHWNSKKLGVVRVLNVKVIDCISRALTKYSEEEIIAAINNYSEVFKSKHYYNLRWTLENFLVKENGISRFCCDGDIWLSYLDLNYKDQEEDDHCLDIEQYIDG
ncbi:hypothetical protein [Clostridium celatum]|uniref:hypothetical protein n=1 Tax=Clostridium celatum TaxID=36834 RepID=UPI0029016EFF|nr:hypothetical protein [Clostridium celatum]MDU2265544.1 hypothetical protein [Clostridium celatum]MDU6295302.1 hypothetical protein [Clostridium celatum]